MGKKKAAPAEPAEAGGQPQQQAQGERARPAFEVRVGRVKAVVWANDGAEGKWFSSAVSRSYKDAQGNWKQAHTFGRDDLLVVAEVCRAVWTWIAQQHGSKFDGPRQQEQPAAVSSYGNIGNGKSNGTDISTATVNDDIPF